MFSPDIHTQMLKIENVCFMTCICLGKSIAWLNILLQKGTVFCVWFYNAKICLCGYATNIGDVCLLHGGMQSLIFTGIANIWPILHAGK